LEKLREMLAWGEAHWPRCEHGQMYGGPCDGCGGTAHGDGNE
jgi:hypothetical protein